LVEERAAALKRAKRDALDGKPLSESVSLEGSERLIGADWPPGSGASPRKRPSIRSGFPNIPRKYPAARTTS